MRARYAPKPGSRRQLKMAGTNRGTMFGPGIYMADAAGAPPEIVEHPSHLRRR